MNKLSLIAIFLISLFYGSTTGAKESDGSLRWRAGPRDDPFAWVDYGGTPDMSVSTGMGLTAAELEGLLSRFSHTDTEIRQEASKQIVENGAGAEQAFRHALWSGHGARNAEIKAVLRHVTSSEGEGGLLSSLLLIDPQDTKNGKGAVASARILSLLEALNALDTLAAYKIMIEFSTRYAGLFRSRVGDMMVDHGLKVMPALIYGRKNEDKEIHMFCVKWIRDLGNPLLSEQVKIRNPRRLAQLLESYAAVNDLAAIDVTLSLSNHESVFVRTAARASIKSYGKNAKWPARRKYENSLGVEPDNSASTQEMLEELFAEFDRARLSRWNALFNEGLAFAEKGDLEKMAEVYREVLRGAPMFPLRADMVDGLLLYSTELEQQGDHRGARRQLVLARRIIADDDDRKSIIASRLQWQVAESLREKGLVDLERYQEIAKTDPSNDEVGEISRILSGLEAPTSRIVLRSLLASFFVFLSGLLLFLRVRPAKQTEYEALDEFA